MAIKSLSIRIDDKMLNKLHVVADYEGRSANSEILVLIREAIEKYEEKMCIRDRDKSHHLLKAEIPGPTSDKLVPKLSDTSKILYGMYIALTLIMVLCLLLSGIGLYDALNISVATAGTGGFAVKNLSIAGYYLSLIHI